MNKVYVFLLSIVIIVFFLGCPNLTDADLITPNIDATNNNSQSETTPKIMNATVSSHYIFSNPHVLLSFWASANELISSVTVTSPEGSGLSDVLLYDDGFHIDNEQNDGEFSNYLFSPVVVAAGDEYVFTGTGRGGSVSYTTSLDSINTQPATNFNIDISGQNISWNRANNSVRQYLIITEGSSGDCPAPYQWLHYWELGSSVESVDYSSTWIIEQDQEYGIYIMSFDSFGNICWNNIVFQEYIETFSIPTASINIDGNASDWSGITPISTDALGDIIEVLSGSDIQALYLSKDNEFLYYQIDINGVTDPEREYRLYLFFDETYVEYGSFELHIESDQNIIYLRLHGSSDPIGRIYEPAVIGNVIEGRIPLAIIPEAFDTRCGVWNSGWVDQTNTIEANWNNISTVDEDLVGTYSGYYSGDDSGDWSVTIDDNGYVIGAAQSVSSTNFNIKGQVLNQGEFLLYCYNSEDLIFEGNIEESIVDGIWHNYSGLSGQFNGSKE